MRIIGGKNKGIQLQTPSRHNIRPTKDQVKEALFNMIQAKVKTNVLDLFSGTGSLGLEALSRGSAFVTFVEKSRQHVKLLNRNINKCGYREQVKIFNSDVFVILDKLVNQYSYDLIMADPPYQQGYSNKLLCDYNLYQLINPSGVCILEHFKHEVININEHYWLLYKQKTYGDTTISFLNPNKE